MAADFKARSRVVYENVQSEEACSKLCNWAFFVPGAKRAGSLQLAAEMSVQLA